MWGWTWTVLLGCIATTLFLLCRLFPAHRARVTHWLRCTVEGALHAAGLQRTEAPPTKAEADTHSPVPPLPGRREQISTVADHSQRAEEMVVTKDLVIVNAGGVKHTISRRHLLSDRCKDSFLYREVKNRRHAVTRQEIFVDFDPEYVRPVLHFLRTGHLCLDTTVSRHAVQDVADALELRELSDLLRSTAVLGRGEFIQWVRSSKHSDIFPNQINVVGLCLSGLTLFNVRLERSLFHGTDFSSSVLRHTYMRFVQGSETTSFEDGRWVDCDASNMTLEGSRLNNLVVERCKVKNAMWTNCHAQKTQILGTLVKGGKFRVCDFMGSRWSARGRRWNVHWHSLLKGGSQSSLSPTSVEVGKELASESPSGGSPSTDLGATDKQIAEENGVATAVGDDDEEEEEEEEEEVGNGKSSESGGGLYQSEGIASVLGDMDMELDVSELSQHEYYFPGGRKTSASDGKVDDVLFQSCNFDNSSWENLMISQVRLADCSFKGATLVGCTLDKPMFRRCRLRGWKLRHCSLVDLESDEATDLFGSACFEGCHFVNVRMSCSPLNGLQFTGCTFDSCSFAEVKSTKLTLQDCTLAHCNLSHGTFSELRLLNVTLKNCLWKGTEFRKGCVLKQCMISDQDFMSCKFGADSIRFEACGIQLCALPFSQLGVAKCAFVDCNISDVSLKDQSMGGCLFENTSLRSCNMSNTRLSHSLWKGASFESCDLASCVCDNWNPFLSSLVEVKNCQLPLLLEGAEFNNMLLDGVSLEQANLSGAAFACSTLRNCVFQSCVLQGCDFSEAILDSLVADDCDFSHCSFTKARVMALRLTSCDFSHADLTDADLQNAKALLVNFEESTLTRTNLCGADLEECKFIRTKLEDTDFSGAMLPRSTWRNICWQNGVWQECDFTQGDLREANFKGVNMSGVNFYGANLTGVNIIELASSERINFSQALHEWGLFFEMAGDGVERPSNVRSRGFATASAGMGEQDNTHHCRIPAASRFEGLELSKIKLLSHNLQNTSFRGSNLQECNLWGCNMSGCNFSGCNLRKANFMQSNLHGANLQGADLKGANLSHAEVGTADFRGACGLDSAQLSGVTCSTGEVVCPSGERAKQLRL